METEDMSTVAIGFAKALGITVITLTGSVFLVKLVQAIITLL